MFNVRVIAKPRSAGNCHFEEQTTLLVAMNGITVSNPNHALYDVITSLLPWSECELRSCWRKVLRFPLGPRCGGHWSGWILSNSGLKHLCGAQLGWEQIRGTPPPCVCFNRLLVPAYTRYRPPQVLPQRWVAKYSEIRFTLTRTFVAPRRRVLLLYGHLQSATKRWLNLASMGKEAKEFSNDIDVVVLDSFSQKWSPWEQCNLFFNATWIVMSHGGQAGNVICCRNRTYIIELVCLTNRQQTGWLQAAAPLRSELNLSYRIEKPDHCEVPRNLHINSYQRKHLNFTVHSSTLRTLLESADPAFPFNPSSYT